MKRPYILATAVLLAAPVSMLPAQTADELLAALRQRRRGGERRAAALARPGYLREVLVEGSRRAQRVAHETMARVREAVHLKY